MTCRDCQKPLNDQEEYQVIISNTNEPRCKRCYWINMNKRREFYKQPQKGAVV
jgi:hypothetical protein